MATRATYQFQLDTRQAPVTFYIHWDGYPDGAAVYFAAAVALDCDPSRAKIDNTLRGGLAEQFLRANPSAEFTGGHSAHGDTEYRYTLSRDHILTVQHERGDVWQTVESAPLAQWLNAHTDMLDPGARFYSHRLRTWTRDALVRRYDDLITEAEHHLSKGWHGNAGGTIAAAKGWPVPPSDPGRLIALLRQLDAAFGHATHHPADYLPAEEATL